MNARRCPAHEKDIADLSAAGTAADRMQPGRQTRTGAHTGDDCGTDAGADTDTGTHTGAHA